MRPRLLRRASSEPARSRSEAAGPVGSDGDTPSAGRRRAAAGADEEARSILQQLDLAFTSRRTAGDDAARPHAGRRAPRRGRDRAAKKLRKEHDPVRADDVHRRVAADRPEPDRAGHAQLGQLRRDERPHRRARDPAEQRPVHPRRRAGRHLAVRRGDRDVVGRRRATRRRRRSARSRSRRRTTRSSTPAPARAPSRATRTSATASSSRPTAATPGRTSRTTSTSSGVAMSRIVVDPTEREPRLRGGPARPRRRAPHQPDRAHEVRRLGVEGRRRQLEAASRRSKDTLGATDLEIDPLNPKILYSSFWGDAIYKSTDGGKKWTPVMTASRSPTTRATQTRFSIAISHPSADERRHVLYAGFDWVDGDGHHQSRVFKSTNGGGSWTMLPGRLRRRHRRGLLRRRSAPTTT